MRSFLFVSLVALSACGGTVHRSEYLGPASARANVKSAAIVPFENLTSRPDAGRVVADSVAAELSGKVRVVERSSSEAALKKLDILPGGTIDRLVAQRLGEMLSVDAVVYGSVAEAWDGQAAPGPRNASVGVSLRVIDVKTGAYLLAGSYSASGSSESAAAAKAAADLGKAVGK